MGSLPSLPGPSPWSLEGGHRYHSGSGMVQPHCAETSGGTICPSVQHPRFPLGFSAEDLALSHNTGPGDLCKDGFRLSQPFKFSRQHLTSILQRLSRERVSVTAPNVKSITGPGRPFCTAMMSSWGHAVLHRLGGLDTGRYFFHVTEGGKVREGSAGYSTPWSLVCSASNTTAWLGATITVPF